VPDTLHCTTCRAQRGSVLLTATVVTLLATMLVIGLAHETALRLEAREVAEGEALLGFGADVPRHSGPMVNLSA
jgi:predicted thioesterase